MKNLIDISGKQYNKLTAISYAGNEKWLFKCDCGVTVVKSSSDVKRDKVQACSRMCGKTVAAKHPLYQTWDGIKKRCFNSQATGYNRYGGAGITMCEEWKNDFWKFVEDMGEKPFPEATIDRINNDGNYCKENCRWADYKTQATNKRNTIFIREGLNIYSLFEICRLLDIKYQTIYFKIKHSNLTPQEYFDQYIF